MSHIVICSEDMRFANALSEVLVAERVADVTHMERPENLEKLTSSEVDLVIADSPLAAFWKGRVLVYPAGKPRKVQAMLADIRAQMAEKIQPQRPLSEWITVDTATRTLQRIDTGTSLELTEKEQALLLFIKEIAEASREEILSAVWGMAPDVDTHTLETHLYRLRQKWRELADFDCIVATDRGYRWYE